MQVAKLTMSAMADFRNVAHILSSRPSRPTTTAGVSEADVQFHLRMLAARGPRL